MAAENDVVLVYFEDKPLFFARIETISPDIKKNWYHVKLLVLQVPLQTVTWILRDVYINGAEFTMGGKRVRLEAVHAPAEDEIPETPPEKEPSDERKGSGSVIPFAARKPKK